MVVQGVQKDESSRRTSLLKVQEGAQRYGRASGGRRCGNANCWRCRGIQLWRGWLNLRGRPRTRPGVGGWAGWNESPERPSPPAHQRHVGICCGVSKISLLPTCLYKEAMTEDDPHANRFIFRLRHLCARICHSVVVLFDLNNQNPAREDTERFDILARQ